MQFEYFLLYERTSKTFGERFGNSTGVGVDCKGPDCECAWDRTKEEVGKDDFILRIIDVILTNLFGFDKGEKISGSDWDLVCLHEVKFNQWSR